MWHTSLFSKISPRIKRIIAFTSLAFILAGSGVFACGGSGTGGGGSVGSGGNAGAPPVNIPAPEALNMRSITISASDSNGTVTVVGSTGAALPNADVRIRNMGPQTAWYQKVLMPSAYAAMGDEIIVKADAAGAFNGQIKALTGDGIALSQKTGLNPGSIEIYGNVPATGTANPDKVVPAGMQKSFIKSKGVLDPSGTGNSWFIQSTSSKKWQWMDLFISNAYAEDLSVQNVNDVNCPQTGPCILTKSVAAHDGYCPLTKLDSGGVEQMTLQVPYCKDLSGIAFGQLKGPPDQNYIGIAGKNVNILKEVAPDKWVVQEVLRFNSPITGIQADVQANDLYFYISTDKGFNAYNVKTRSLLFYSTKIGQMSSVTSVLPTAFTKKGSHILYASWINNQAWLVQGDLSSDPNFSFQRVITSAINKPISEILILEADVNKSVELQSGKLAYKANEIAFIAGKNLYFMEIPTNASYATLTAELLNHADLDLSKLEKMITVSFPEGSKDLNMMAYNPDQTLMAVSDGDKVYYADCNYGESIPLQAMRVNRVTDLRGEGSGPASVLVYNPVTRNFMLRGLSDGISLGTGQVSGQSVGSQTASSTPRVVSISISDRSLPDASSRVTPREAATTRDQVEINVRSSSSLRSITPVTSPGAVPVQIR